MTHELKILPRWFEDVKSGKKNFEIRRSDRNFKVGDTLLLKEYEHGGYTGREIKRTIQYIYKGDGAYGLSEEFCILGLKTMKGEDTKSKEYNCVLVNIKNKDGWKHHAIYDRSRQLLFTEAITMEYAQKIKGWEIEEEEGEDNA